MVVFSCDGCGEMLKKSQVDGHAHRCRTCDSVSCVDCSVSFFGDDYRAHTSCLTEAERYEKTAKSKKQTPQQAWMNVILSSIDTAPPHLLQHLQIMVTLDNVPRKEKAFRNFTSNSLKLRGNGGETVVSELWEYLKALREAEQQRKQTQQEKQTIPKKNPQKDSNNKDTPLTAGSDTAKDKATTVKQPVTTAPSLVHTNKKDVRKLMKKLLKQSGSLKLKQLQKSIRCRTQASKHMVKDLIQQNLVSKKTFVVNGKRVSLKVVD